jgi:RNA polymerase sigma factor (sigma-70 family)
MKSDILTSTFMRFRASLRGVAAGIAGSDNAEDILHDAFCRLWARHHDVRNESEAMKLSYTAVRNNAIDFFRAKRAHPNVVMDDCVEYDHIDDSDAEREQQETYEAVVRLSRQVLNDTQYQVFRLHDIEGIGYPEIAATLGMSQENVRMTLSRARKAIRELYRKTNHV